MLDEEDEQEDEDKEIHLSGFDEKERS